MKPLAGPQRLPYSASKYLDPARQKGVANLGRRFSFLVVICEASKAEGQGFYPALGRLTQPQGFLNTPSPEQTDIAPDAQSLSIRCVYKQTFEKDSGIVGRGAKLGSNELPAFLYLFTAGYVPTPLEKSFPDLQVESVPVGCHTRFSGGMTFREFQQEGGGYQKAQIVAGGCANVH